MISKWSPHMKHLICSLQELRMLSYSFVFDDFLLVSLHLAKKTGQIPLGVFQGPVTLIFCCADICTLLFYNTELSIFSIFPLSYFNFEVVIGRRMYFGSHFEIGFNLSIHPLNYHSSNKSRYL